MNKLIIWSRKNLFSNSLNSTASIIIIAIFIKVFLLIINWLVIEAVVIGDALQCRESSGFCYPFLKAKFSFILFGFYPQKFLWRPVLGIFIFIFSTVYFLKFSANNFYLFLKLIGTLVVFFFLLRGGIGLEYVSPTQWGGLPLTILLSAVGIYLSYPLGIVLALARRSKLLVMKSFSIIFIELIRGVPLISVLFMSSVLFPLFLPEQLNIDKLLRAQIAIVLFSSAYMAEVVRGGLASIENGQYEAAKSLNLNYFQTMIFVILPQALTRVIPPTVSTAIGLFKDTSLVLIIALFDLLSTAKSSVKDPEWLGFSLEAYTFVALIYFVFCFSMSVYAKRLEEKLDV